MEQLSRFGTAPVRKPSASATPEQLRSVATRYRSLMIAQTARLLETSRLHARELLVHGEREGWLTVEIYQEPSGIIWMSNILKYEESAK